MEQAKQLLENILKAMTELPDRVRVEVEADERGVLFTAYTDLKDMGYVIGRGGANISAIRTIMKAAGAKSHCTYIVKVSDPRE